VPGQATCAGTAADAAIWGVKRSRPAIASTLTQRAMWPVSSVTERGVSAVHSGLA
jgi:hypothetical protein